MQVKIYEFAVGCAVKSLGFISNESDRASNEIDLQVKINEFAVGRADLCDVKICRHESDRAADKRLGR